MIMPNPVRPPPVICPRSLWVNPNWAPQSPRIPPRIENPTPAARMAIKPAHNSRLALGAIASLLTCTLLIGEESRGGLSEGKSVCAGAATPHGQHSFQGGIRANGGAVSRG